MTPTQSYGNIRWEYFVYGTYACVAFFLILFIFLSIRSRNKALKSLVEEGFLQTKNESLHEKKI